MESRYTALAMVVDGQNLIRVNSGARVGYLKPEEYQRAENMSISPFSPKIRNPKPEVLRYDPFHLDNWEDEMR